MDKLKHEDPAKCWERIKLISVILSPESNLFDHITFNGENVDIMLLPDVMNSLCQTR